MSLGGWTGFGSLAQGRNRLALVGLVALVVLLVGRERGSVERANRLHRSGSSNAAAEIYRARAETSSAELHYNLGTTLLGLGGSPAGQASLDRALGSSSLETRTRALYNLGLLNLTRALTFTESDSARSYAITAVRYNREALRLQPSLADAKWNLSMARRMLDSLEAVARRSGGTESDRPVDPDALVRSETTPEGEEDEVRDEASLEGEAEALVESGDPPLLTPEAALEILDATPANGALIMQKLWGLESRGRWGQQTGKVRRPW